MAGNNDNVLLQGQVGPQTGADGARFTMRQSKTGAAVMVNAQGFYSEGTTRGRVFSAALTATTTGVAAGQIIGAAAAAATQFAITNPANSGKDLHLLKFGLGVISGTAGAGPVWHGLILTAPTLASIGGVVRNNNGGAASGSVVIPQVLAAGSALTGGSAPVALRAANFSSTGTAQASVGMLGAIEIIDGDIVIPPGVTWLPLHPAAGTSLLHGYSLTWEEVDRPS